MRLRVLLAPLLTAALCSTAIGAQNAACLPSETCTPQRPAARPAGATRNVSYAPATELRDIVTVASADGGRYSFSRRGLKLTVSPRSADATVNGAPVTLRGAPFIADGRLHVPVAMLKHVGCRVELNQPRNLRVMCPGVLRFVDVNVW